MLLFVQQFFATEIVSANFAELIAENSNAEESKNEEFKAPPKPLTFEEMLEQNEEYQSLLKKN